MPVYIYFGTTLFNLMATMKNFLWMKTLLPLESSKKKFSISIIAPVYKTCMPRYKCLSKLAGYYTFPD